MTNISELQNSQDNIDLLAAMKVMYSEAKRIQALRWTIALLIGAVGTALLFVPQFQKQFKPYLAILGVLWMVLDTFALSLLEKGKRLQAARIQEEFDTNVFALDWNKEVAGLKVAPEEVSRLSRKYGKAKRGILEDWYPNTSPVTGTKSVLLCQRVNAVWNKRLTRNFTYLLRAFSFLVCMLLIIIGAVNNFEPPSFLGLFCIWSAFIIMNFKLSMKVSEASEKSEALEKRILELWELAIKPNQEIQKRTIRQLQDEIFRNRSSQVASPDILQRWFRDEYHQDAAYAVEKLKESALGAKSSNRP